MLKNKILILIILILIPMAVNSLDKKLTKNFLTTTLWITSDSKYYISIYFHKDGRYEIYEPFEGGSMLIEGEYAISNNVLTLKSKKIHDESLIPKELKKTETKWKLEDEDKSMLYALKIVSDTGFPFYCQNFKPKAGEIREFKGIKVVILKQEYVTINKDAQMKEGPGTKYKTVRVSYDPKKDKVFREMDYIIKGWKVISISRTVQKDKVNGMEDYWYLCKFYELDIEPFENFEGWIFGGFIDK